jgi:cysteine synthase
MPDDVSIEKVKALEALGAEVERVRPASIVDKKQVCGQSVKSYTLTLHSVHIVCRELWFV